MLGKFSVKKPYTVLVAVVLAIVLGIVSFMKMSVDLLPGISLPYVIVMTTYPGASPETVEMAVTKPVEASMATVSNIEEIRSVSSENYSLVILEFAQSTDMNAVSLEIRENLDQIKSYWGDSVGNPIIIKMNPDMLPVMIAAVGGVDMTEAEVSEMTQNTVIPELESIEGVASASAVGLVEESVNVIIRQEKIDAINEQVFGYIDGEMQDAVQELADAKQEVQDGQTEIDNAKTELEGNKKKLEDSQKELNDKRKELEESRRQLEEGRSFMSEEDYAAAVAQLEDGEAQLNSGQRQLNSALSRIKDGEEQLNDSGSQLDDAMQQVIDGETELEEARENAYEQADMSGILTVDTVKSLLAAQNFSMPAGYVTEEGVDYLVRVGDKPDDIEVFKKMPVMNPEMAGVDVITLEDVADVFVTDNSADIYANVNGEPGILITIQKQTGYSTGDVSDRILDKFEELKEERGELILITLMDQGIYIDLVMDSIINNVLFGAILAVLVLILFLRDWRPTAVVACSIPISIITAIVCMYFSGVTLNVISLSGLALGVGMLVDNSIVVIENIYRMRNEGYSAKEAAVKGAGEVSGAIMASTLTTVCVFLPIVFTEGITRQLFVDMGLTIGYSLFASLLVAMTVVPAMGAGVLSKSKPQKENKIFGRLMDIYEKTLRLSLKYKPIVLIMVIAFLAVSVLAAFSKGIAFMPDMDSPQMTMTLTMPKDTALTETGEVTDQVLERIMAMNDVADVGAMASSSSLGMLSGGNSATNKTSIYIALSENKDKTNEEIAMDINANIADILEENQAEASIETSNMDMSALGGSGITVQIKGRDLDTLQRIAKDIAAIVEGVEGTEAVSDGLEESTGELRIIIDKDKAIGHGLTVAQVFAQIQPKLASAASATTFETETEEFDVYVRYAGDMELTRELLKDFEIERTKLDGTKESVKLSDIASFENTQTPKSVNRIDQTRYIAVSAAIADGYNIGFVSDDVKAALKDYEMPAGYRYTMSGENETITDAMQQVYLMLVLAIIFMYLIMVAQFQSLLSPFIILFTIPLAFTGGFLGLFISGSEVSVIALIGFVMLSGIIVNNGIVLVDYINQLCEGGMEKREAIMTAGRTRMRPVMMTALTTILALSTMVFSNEMGADMSRPMSIVAIGGLVYGTLLTLIVIPCIYDMFINSGKKKFSEKSAMEEPHRR